MNNNEVKQKDHFDPGEFHYSTEGWAQIVKERRESLTPEWREWLHAWEILCAHCGYVMKGDKERAMVRYGHCIGWFDHKSQCDREKRYKIQGHRETLR